MDDSYNGSTRTSQNPGMSVRNAEKAIAIVETHQTNLKENYSNRNGITTTTLLDNIDTATESMITTKSSVARKVQSLSNIRNVGCINPMAFTLWNHPSTTTTTTMMENVLDTTSTSPNHDPNISNPWTIRENLHLLDSLDSIAYGLHVIPTNETTGASSNRLTTNHDDDCLDDKWDIPSLFVPVTPTTTTITTSETGSTSSKDIISVDHDAISRNVFDPTELSLSLSFSNNGANDPYDRRHSLPDYVSKPIPLRPSSSSLSSILDHHGALIQPSWR
jgi:hypothetical protein